MGEPAAPTFAERQRAIELAREAIEGVRNDEPSWFNSLEAATLATSRDVDTGAIFVMMQMLLECVDALDDA